MSQLRLLCRGLRSLVQEGSAEQHRQMGQLALRSTGLKAGSMGRQSISGVVATVFGVSGFLGRYVIAALGEMGSRVVCPYRCDELDMQHLWPMGDLGNIITLEDFSIRDEAFIRNSIAKSNVVINVIGQYTETWNYGFKEVHEDWPRRLAELCAETPSVERLIQVSCLGAEAASPSPRLASKAAGDAAVMRAFPDATLVRAGPLVGVEDRFFNDFALWRYSNNGVPVYDGGYNRVQPAFAVDVAEAIVKTLEYEEAKGETYELGGPDAVMMKEVAYRICDEMREDRKLTQVPSFLAMPLAAVRERLAHYLPMHMMTRDLVFTSSSIAEGRVDKVVAPGAKTFADLHITPRPVFTGVAIDHVRHWRKGGYDVGTNEPERVP